MAQVRQKTFGWFFRGFNWAFGNAQSGYALAIARITRMSVFVLLIYVGLLGLTYWSFGQIPTGFIPPQDQGYLVVSIHLPEGASLSRTDEVTRSAARIVRETAGVEHAVALAGLSGATRILSTNSAAIFVILQDATARAKKGLLMPQILATLRKRLAEITDGQIVVVPPPPVRGIGTVGGFQMMVQDRTSQGPQALLNATQDLAAKNAILIVEFAKQQEDEGLGRFAAVVQACRLRLRPILMTALAFILGVLPLVVAAGPGYEMRQAAGTAVFSGMLGVTLFGLFLTPVFYVALRGLLEWVRKRRSTEFRLR